MAAQKQSSIAGPIVIMFLAKAFQTDTRPRLEARILLDAGYRVFVLAWDRYSEFQAFENVDEVAVKSFHHLNLRSFSKFKLAAGAVILQALLFWQTLRLIAALKQRPILHANDFNTFLPSCLLKMLRLAHRLVYDYRELTYAIYGEWFSRPLSHAVRVIEETYLSYADAVITVSEPIAKYLVRFNPRTELVYNSARTAEIPSVSKTAIRSKLGLPVKAFIVSYVGEIRYGCRLDLMLAAASLIRSERVIFLVVGGGPLANEFGQRARSRQIMVLPWQPRERAILYTAASDLTWVLYSKASLNSRISMPRKLLESLACGVPVLADRDTLAANLVNRYGCGVVVDTDDPDQILQDIKTLADHPSRYHSMSVATKFAARDFSWERMSSKLLGIYEGLRQTASHFEGP
jgi:glycosyltransferase involved in cell wall biosynthesis